MEPMGRDSDEVSESKGVQSALEGSLLPFLIDHPALQLILSRRFRVGVARSSDRQT